MTTNPASDTSKAPAGAGMRAFLLIWFGQFISLIGSSLTSFALGVWVYERTGSVTQFALIALAAELPSIVVAPFLGALVDRWDRRKVMLLSDTGAALGTLVIALLFFSNRLEVWHIILVLPFNVIFRSFQAP